MTLHLQAKLLRFLQERGFYRITEVALRIPPQPAPAKDSCTSQDIVLEAVADGALSTPAALYAATWKYHVAGVSSGTT